jgi:UDP-N-acetylglucosamine--N-acetylmuramyl-(pentapeptide) pyrophosphoryl-undecaprenol N-acetylglucosamine transferase
METTLLIAAGGTGGHLFPGIAVADEVRRRDPQVRVVFVGTPRGLESRLVPRAGYPLEMLPILPLNNVGLARTLKGLLALPRAMWAAWALLRRLRPRTVLGIGGYAGGPVVLMAALTGVRTVILEPNATPGFTNRVLRPFVKAAACAYEPALAHYPGKGVLTGNPVRGGFAPSSAERDAGAPKALLVFGGSQGSRILNRAMVAALPALPGPDLLRIVHQTGEAMRAEVETAYGKAGRGGEVHAFLDDMPARFAEADLIVCRSGATTCAELTAAGKASILVPFAQAADDHQKVNAETLAKAGAARMIEEKVLGGGSLAEAITKTITDEDALASMERAALGLARPDAAARVADLLELAPPGAASRPDRGLARV